MTDTYIDYLCDFYRRVNQQNSHLARTIMDSYPVEIVNKIAIAGNFLSLLERNSKEVV